MTFFVKNRFPGLFLLFFFIASYCNSQISFVSNCGSPYPNYTVTVKAAIVSFTKTNNGGGCNINVGVAYTVSVNGTIPNGWCGGGGGGSLDNLHINFNCGGGSFEAHLPHTAGTGIVCACNNQGVSGNATCAALTLAAYCSNPTVNVQIGGPGINTNADFPFTLPIELLYFKAEKSDRSSLLTWSTATELNNSHFTVERSSNGVDWEVLETIKGAGNSLKKINYEYRDKKPLPSINYYRLKQTDFDGIFSYSNTEYIEYGSEGSINSIIYPNPTVKDITVFVSATNSKPLTTSVYDATGRLLSTEEYNSSDNTLKTILSMPETSGIYFVVISQSGQIIGRHRVCVNTE